jgi:nucleoid-associated protein YgaU
MQGEVAAGPTAPKVPSLAPAEEAQGEPSPAIAPGSAEATTTPGPPEVAQNKPVEPQQPIEITGAEVSSPPPSDPTAEANVEAFKVAGLAVVGSAEQPESLSVTTEAAPGVLEARDMTIKAAEAESQTLYVAGEAPAGSIVRVFANDELLGETSAASNGAWLLEVKKEVPVGVVDLQAEALSDGGEETIPAAEASQSFMRYADGVVLAPVVTASSEDRVPLSNASPLPQPHYVIIRRRDNLWRIARRNYGRGIKYQAIFAANRDLIRNPHWIYPGQVLVVPTRDRSWETVEQ